MNYEDYSSGRVLYGAPMATNFPVSLTLEIYKRCSDYSIKNGNSGPYTIYDPFCGVAYSLTVLGFFNGNNIKQIIASDVDKTTLEFARKNLSLLTQKGIENRVNELNRFIKEYNKDSHKEALVSAKKLKIISNELKIEIKEFQHNIISNDPLPKFVNKIDMIITDLPYGKLTNWEGAGSEINPAQQFLNKIKDRLKKNSVIAIVFNKQQKVLYEGFNKVRSFKIGKRKVIILSPLYL